MIVIIQGWDIYKADLLRMVGEFHQFGRLVRGINSSFIVLIPKKDNSTELKDYRPISLINGVYKIISKLLARRLSRVLNSIISEQQSAIVGGRQILDSVITLNETIDEAKRRNVERFFFKIDFAKAYDTVDWAYLRMMMERFRFDTKWILWVMECVSTASVAILLNGSPTDEFRLGRGLRQGDPLSPFLFLIAAEGLSSMMSKATELGLFKAAEVGRNKVLISHLQFADDTIFLGKASRENTVFVKRFLRLMEIASGLKVNFDKCCVYGINVNEERLAEMANTLRCRTGSIPFDYLGIKVGVEYRRASDWECVVQKVKNRLKRWESNKISIGGRVTLLNVVLTTIPLYYLSTYRIPKKTLRELISLQRNFLWGGGKGSRKIAWVEWKTVCK